MTDRRDQEVDAASAFRSGDEDAFARISHHYYRELHVHCYRMIGSFDEAEDLVQETMMKAWQRRESYAGRAGVRAWLYRIATNVCIDAIRARTSRGASEAMDDRPRYSSFPWMQPYPDTLLDAVEGRSTAADERVVLRDTIELAFLATIQLLPAKQRAVLILRDVLDFSAVETAEFLEDSTAAVNSALQRARATLDKHRGSLDRGGRASGTTFNDAVLLQVFMDAQDRGDVNAIVDLLRDDVRMTLLPDGHTWDGRDEVARELRRKRADFDGDIRSVPIAANRQPAVAVYTRRTPEVNYQAWGIVLLGVREGKLREIATFTSPELFSRFQLPVSISA
jgi:RNA polymerase sigma-70 factor (ECF subfamily)